MITDDEFARLVAEEVKNKLSPTQRKVLMQPENLDRWKRALIALIENLDGQLDDLAADESADNERYRSFGREGKTLLAQAQTAYKVKIAKISRFRFHVSRRLDEVMSIIEGEDTEQTDVWQEAAFLRKAISMHKKLIREYDLEETSIDKALWLALNGEWMFDAITVDNI